MRFDQSSPLHPVSESRGGTLSVTDGARKSLCLILDAKDPAITKIAEINMSRPFPKAKLSFQLVIKYKVLSGSQKATPFHKHIFLYDPGMNGTDEDHS